MMPRFNRILLVVMDSVGAGAMPDAEAFGDAGSDTLGHIDEHRGLNVPTLERLGLGTIRPYKTIQDNIGSGAFAGKMAECSAGKDTITGHWEFMGIVQEVPFPVYPDGFPESLMQRFSKETGYGYLGNKAASGTAIIAELGQEHLDTGKLIVYTSADSVFQIAACETIVPVDELYRVCEITRNRVTVDEHAVSRVIARPFVPDGDGFQRTGNRKDYSLEPPENALDLLTQNNVPVGAIGKIEDMFAFRGISSSVHSKNNREAYRDLVAMMNTIQTGLIFANFVDFDMLYGHRRNVDGYGDALEEFDCMMADLLNHHLAPDDLLLITADHGCDPAFKGTDHTREFVPLLAYSPALSGSGRIPTRSCFSDLAATCLDNFGIPNPFPGASILEVLQ